MNVVTIISRDDAAGTVTISQADLARLVTDADDADDLRAARHLMARIADAGGIAAYRAASLTPGELRQVLAGESPIRIVREKRGLTQAQLSEQAGVSTATIGMIETGQRKPSVSSLKRIANVLDVATDDLL